MSIDTSPKKLRDIAHALKVLRCADYAEVLDALAAEKEEKTAEVPLPDPANASMYCYTTDDMRQYGQACAKAARAEAFDECRRICADIADKYAETEGRLYPELKSDAQTGAGDCEIAIIQAAKERST